MSRENVFFRNSKEAFNNAIQSGVLSIDKDLHNYAGAYMYMHSELNRDYFKNINSRQYISATIS